MKQSILLLMVALVVAGCIYIEKGDKSPCANMVSAVVSHNVKKNCEDLTDEDFAKMAILNLLNGGIFELEVDAFRKLVNLRELQLAGNRLQTLPVGIFEGLRYLKILDLSRNNLSTLPEHVFDDLEVPGTHVWLSGNYFSELEKRRIREDTPQNITLYW